MDQNDSWFRDTGPAVRAPSGCHSAAQHFWRASRDCLAALETTQCGHILHCDGVSVVGLTALAIVLTAHIWRSFF